MKKPILILALFVMSFGSLSAFSKMSFKDFFSTSNQITKTRYYSGIAYTIGASAAYHYIASSPRFKSNNYLRIGSAFLATGGLGHMIQGRYLQHGWMFTLGDVIEAGLAIGINAFLVEDGDKPPNMFAALYLPLAVEITFSLLELVDLVWLPKNMKLVDNLSIQPMLTADAKTFGLNLKYRW